MMLRAVSHHARILRGRRHFVLKQLRVNCELSWLLHHLASSKPRLEPSQEAKSYLVPVTFTLVDEPVVDLCGAKASRLAKLVLVIVLCGPKIHTGRVGQKGSQRCITPDSAINGVPWDMARQNASSTSV